MKICIIACLDTKGAECEFLKKQFDSDHHKITIINTGIFASLYNHDINIQQIVGEEDTSLLASEIAAKNQSKIIELICRNASFTIPALIDINTVDVIIGMGGANGTLLSTCIMRLFPNKTRKICISTLAPAHLDLDKYAADKIELVPAIVDLCGLNIVTQHILQYVAIAILQKIPTLEFKSEDNLSIQEKAIQFQIDYLKHLKIIPQLQNTANKIIAITMFGNTTICAEACHKQLTHLGYQVIMFHATGIGGEIMRYLIEQQCIKAGVLDITTTELADLICGGSMSASRERFYAPTKHGIPHLIAPGCLDMVNFIPNLPEKYADRKFFAWGAHMQLMRTNTHENVEMGIFLVDLAHQAKSHVEFVLPTGGFSHLGQQDNFFHDNQADMAFIQTIQNFCHKDLVTTVNLPINDAEISNILVRKIHMMILRSESKSIGSLPHLHANNSSLPNRDASGATMHPLSDNPISRNKCYQ